MTKIKFPAFGTAPVEVAVAPDPFQDAADVVRAKITVLNGLFHTGSESIAMDIDNAALQGSVALEAMRDMAAAMPPNHKRDSAFEYISALSGQLTRRLEKLAQDSNMLRAKSVILQLDTLMASRRSEPLPFPGNRTIH